jgi:hypothetical protein
MGGKDPLQSPEHERIERDLQAGLAMGVLSPAEAAKLRRHVAWATTRDMSWSQLTAFHHAHSAFLKMFESTETRERLPVVRASYFKLLANSNGEDVARWDYGCAENWKTVVLSSTAYTQPSLFVRKTVGDLVGLLRQRFRPVLDADVKGAAREGGAIGEVQIFTWKGSSWAYKAAGTDTHDCMAGINSGVAGAGANLNGRSIASYALARALGLEALMVDTQWAFRVSGKSVQHGILMSGAKGLQPKRRYMPVDRAEALKVSRADMSRDDVSTLWQSSLREYLPAAFEKAVLKQAQCAVDLVAAQWLDFVCAQVDRHDENYFIHCEGRGAAVRYRGLSLIDNDMAFGANVDTDETLAGYHGSNFLRLPDLVPPGLGEALARVLRGIGRSAHAYWRSVQSVPDLQEPAPVQAVAAAEDGPDVQGSLAEVALNITEAEFVALHGRLQRAKASADRARVMTEAIVSAEYAAYLGMDPPARADATRSYWHRVVDLHSEGSTRGALPEASVTKADFKLEHLLAMPGSD